MKKTYDRKVFKRKLLSDRRTVTVTIRLFMILLLFFPLLTRAGTVDSTRVGNREVRGKVVDENKLPIPGVSVRLGGTSMGTATDVDGKFKLFVPADTATLVVSFIGMKTVRVKIPKLKAGEVRKVLSIVLWDEDVKLEDVVVTGIFTRKKESFTGSASTYSAAELKTMGTQNILQSLKTLDPAFAILEDNQFGSDPNRLPNMEIRGKSSMLGLRDELDADPNQPLFILDGFESTLAAINDLDINRVASITILKDAASTAIYGSKAANGVIVITTKKGKAKSKLEISADAYWSVSSRADLDYLFNMASAENQFRFEELMHKYDPINLTSNDPYTRTSARRRYMSAPYGMLYERDNKKNLTAGEYEAKKQELIELGNRGVWKDDLNEYIFQRMMRQQYNVSLRGAAEKLDYAFSASYDDEDSYLQENGKRRVLLNLASNARLTKNLTFELAVNTMFSREESNGTSIESVRGWLSPWTRLKDEEGNFVHVPTSQTVYEPLLMSEEYYAGKTPTDWTYNPVADRDYTDNYSKTMNYRVQGGFEYRTE